MHPFDAHLSPSDQWPRNTSSPPFQVIGTNEHGIILETYREYEIGASIAIGFHVDRPETRKSHFISAESIVVDSRPSMKQGELVHRVTMLFSEIKWDDRELLLALSSDPNFANSDEVETSDSPPKKGKVSLTSLN